MLRETYGDEHLLTMHLPPVVTNTLNEPNVENSVGCGRFWATRLCGRAAAGEVDVFNIIFCTHKQ
jgi:hypothetical protein